MRKGAGDTKVVTGNKFEILNADEDDEDDEEIELDDEAVCVKDRKRALRIAKPFPYPLQALPRPGCPARARRR